MKQTLFEAEAVISVNTDKMFADLDKAAREAKKRLQDALGGLSVPTLGGGRGGSGGGGRGGGGSYVDKMFGENMKYARLEKSVGQYSQAISRLTNLMNNYKLSAMQATEAETLLERIQAKRNQLQGKIQKQADREFQKAQKGQTSPIGPYGNTSAATDAMFKTEMAMARASKAAKDYGDAIARLTALTNNNRLSAVQAAQAQTALTNAIAASEKAAIVRSGGGGGTSGSFGDVTPGSRRRNAQIQNASFAIQDFITVMSMGGGFSRAMASASNNFGFMLSMMGTTTGAISALAVTIGALLIPTLWKAALGVEDMGDKLDGVRDRANALKESMQAAREEIDFWGDIGEKFKAGDVGGIEDEVRKALVEKRKLESDLDSARRFRSKEMETVADDFIKALGINARFVGQDWLESLRRGEVSAEDVDKIVKTTDWTDTLMGTADNWEHLATRLREIDAPAQDAANALNKLQFRIAHLGALAEEAAKERMEKPLMTAQEIAIAEAEQRRAGMPTREEQIEGLEKKRKAISDVRDLFTAPEDAQIEKINKLFEGVMSQYTSLTAGGAEMLLGLEGLRKAAIDRESKKDLPSITGSMGTQQFASQLTNQLLQRDPTERLIKITEDQKAILERLAGDENGIVRAIKEYGPSNVFKND